MKKKNEAADYFLCNELERLPLWFLHEHFVRCSNSGARNTLKMLVLLFISALISTKKSRATFEKGEWSSLVSVFSQISHVIIKYVRDLRKKLKFAMAVPPVSHVGLESFGSSAIEFQIAATWKILWI